MKSLINSIFKLLLQNDSELSDKVLIVSTSDKLEHVSRCFRYDNELYNITIEKVSQEV